MVIGTGPANGNYSGQVSAGHSPAGPVTPSITSIPTERSDPFSGTNPHGHGLASGTSPRNQTAVSGASSPSWDPAIFKPNITGYPAIAGINFSGDKYRIKPASKPLTGFSKPECGTWVRKLKSGDEVRDLFHNCGVLGCPKCGAVAITQKAREAEKRFVLYETAKLEENAVLIPGERRDALPRHIAFTLSPAHTAELWTRAGKDHAVFLDLARAELMEILKDCGMVGGINVYHDSRVRHPDTGNTGARAKHLITMEAKIAGNMRDDSPASDMYVHMNKQENWADYYYFSPHFHHIGFGSLPELKDFEELFPGWRYHNKGVVYNTGGMLRYLFTHQAMIPDRYAVSWTGRLSPAALAKEETGREDREVLCQKTGLPWVIIDSLVAAEIGRTYTEPVIFYRSFFRKGTKRALQDPDAVRFPKGDKRSMAPHEVHEKGILAMAKYCDEWGKL